MCADIIIIIENVYEYIPLWKITKNKIVYQFFYFCFNMKEFKLLYNSKCQTLCYFPPFAMNEYLSLLSFILFPYIIQP